MTLEDHLIAEGLAVEETYACPVTGWTGPAFAFVWVAGDERWPTADFIHGELYLMTLREEEAALPPPAPSWSPACEIRNAFVARRRRRLLDSDWTQGADSPLGAEAKADWATYRQALRDLPEAFASPDLVAWPVDPDGGS